MKQEIVSRGIGHGWGIITNTVRENGSARVAKCDHCGNGGKVIPTYYPDKIGNPYAYCADCWVADIEECDRQWGTVSEYIGVTNPNKTPRTHYWFMLGVSLGMRQMFDEVK